MHSFHFAAALIIFHGATGMAPRDGKCMGHLVRIELLDFSRRRCRYEYADNALCMITPPHHSRQQTPSHTPARFVSGSDRGDKLFTANGCFLRQREGHRQAGGAGVPAALIIIVIQLAALAEGSIDERGVVHRRLVAVVDDGGRAALLIVLHESVNGLIPIHG